MTKQRPKRLAIIPAGLGELPVAAFEYLVLKLNTLQRNVEFEFLPIDKSHPFLLRLRPNEPFRMDDFRQKTPNFLDWLDKEVLSSSVGYDLPPVLPDRYVIVTLSSFDTHWYSIWEERYSAIFLGDWEDTMAPPSLLDLMLSLIMVEGLVCLVGQRTHDFAHLGTRGCATDFNSTLRDVRYKTLQGFLCSDCRSVLKEKIGVKSTENWIKILDKGWVGSSSDPNSPANISAKLGYELFLTKGLSLNLWQRVLQSLRQDGVIEFIKLAGGFIFALILAVLLFLLKVKN